MGRHIPNVDDSEYLRISLPDVLFSGMAFSLLAWSLRMPSGMHIVDVSSHPWKGDGQRAGEGGQMPLRKLALPEDVPPCGAAGRRTGKPRGEIGVNP